MSSALKPRSKVPSRAGRAEKTNGFLPALKERNEPFGLESSGILMTPEEFDNADFDECWNYELINGVLIVTPIPLEEEVGPNEYLGHLLLKYQEDHPQGTAMNATLPERYVKTNGNRRRPDRVIWAGLGRHPRRGERPTIIVEFVSNRKRDRVRDYETKLKEYLRIKVKEYWVIDRFMRTMTVFSAARGKTRAHVVGEDQTYTTELLPGFVLPLVSLLARADRWAED